MPRPPLPRTVWALGITSLLMDTASESIHALLPVFLIGTLGATPAFLGVLEGVAEGVASATKPLAGFLSDRWRDRKWLTVFGYALAAVSKPLFAVAPSAGWVFGARVSDRFGKGVRGAPRDALIADVTPPSVRGAAFGLRQALDTVGAFAGPLCAILAMTVFGAQVRTVFWLATIPAILAVLVLVVAVRNPEAAPVPPKSKTEVSALLRSGGLVRTCVLGAVLTLARFSEAFLILRAQQAGLPLAWMPVVLVVMNTVYALGAYPAGLAADRLPPAGLLGAGALVLALADVVLASGGGIVLVLFGIALWGLHMALTQGVLSAMVSATAPPGARGTAFGLFTLITAVATIAASTLAGLLWQAGGAMLTFSAGVGFATIAAVGSFAVLRGPPSGLDGTP